MNAYLPADHRPPRLMLLGVEPCDFLPGVQIWAHYVVDGKGRMIAGCHTKAEGEKIRQRFAARYSKESFHVQ